MRKFMLFLMPLAAILAGCGTESVTSDEEFLEEISQVAEVAPPSDYKSPTMIIDASGPMPNIELETDHYIIGTVPGDRLTDGIVKIRNTGDGPLEIKNVTTSCSCTKGHVNDRIVDPGEEVDMVVTIDPSLIPGFEATRVLTIESNDPDVPAYPVLVTSYVAPEVIMIPGSANLGGVMAGKGLTRRFILRQVQTAPFEILSARCTLQSLSADFRLLPEEEWLTPGFREYELLLTVAADAPLGRLDSKLSLETNLLRTRRLQYEVSGIVHINPYTMVPRTIQYSEIAPGTTIEGVFQLTSDGPIAIKSTNADGTDLELIARQTGGMNEVIFDVAVGPNVAPGRLSQVWDISFDVSGVTYAEQLIAVVTTPAATTESD